MRTTVKGLRLYDVDVDSASRPTVVLITASAFGIETSHNQIQTLKRSYSLVANATEVFLAQP